MQSFKEIKSNIKTLSREEGLSFALLLIRGLIPNYTFFNRKEAFGDLSIIMKIYNLGAIFLKTSEVNEDLEKLEEELFSISPNSEYYPSVYSTYALDVCSICYDILHILKSEDEYIEAVLRSCEVSENTSYIYTMESLQLNEYNEEEVYSNEIMYKERQRQSELLQLLKNNRSIKELIDIINDIPKESVIGLS